MAKYCFKVYLDDDTSVRIVPFNLGSDGVDLAEIDKFVYKCNDSFSLQSVLASELGIGFERIKKISILQPKKNIEFSIIRNNPYLDSVLTTVRRKKITNYQNYEMDAVVVSSDNKSYIDMKKYLFENIEADYKFFLNEIYKYNNEFAKLLYRYGSVYNQGLYSEEDVRSINELKIKIEIGLSIYKNYRGLCKARYEYEKKYFSPYKNKPTRQLTEIKLSNPEYKEKEFTQTDLNYLNQYTNDLGEEREEFLDIEERESEDYYGKRR